jgi:hypothetical protein
MENLQAEIKLNEVCFITDKNGKKHYFQKILTDDTVCTSCINYNVDRDKDLGLCDICRGTKIIFKGINEKDIEQMIYIIEEVFKHGTLNRGAYPSKEQAEERIKYLESKYPCNCYRIDTCIYFPYGDPSKIREINIESEYSDK